MKFVIRNVYTYDCLQLKMRLSKAAVVPIKHDEVLGFLGSVNNFGCHGFGYTWTIFWCTSAGISTDL